MNILSFSETMAGVSLPGTAAVPVTSAISFADALLAAQPGAPAEVPNAGGEVPQAAECVLETLRQQTAEAPAPPIFAARPGPAPSLPVPTEGMITPVAPSQPEAEKQPGPADVAVVPVPLVATAEPSHQEKAPTPAPVQPEKAVIPSAKPKRSRASEEKVEPEPATSDTRPSEQVEAEPVSASPRVARNSGKGARAVKSAPVENPASVAALPANAAVPMTPEPLPKVVLDEQPVVGSEPCEQRGTAVSPLDPPERARSQAVQPQASRPAMATETAVAFELEEQSPAAAGQPVPPVVQPSVRPAVTPKGKRGGPPAETAAAEPQDGLPQVSVLPTTVAALPVIATAEAKSSSKAVEQVGPAPQSRQPRIPVQDSPPLPADAAIAKATASWTPPADQPASELPQTTRSASTVRGHQASSRLAAAAVASEVALQVPPQSLAQPQVSQAEQKPASAPTDPGQAPTVVASAEPLPVSWVGLPGMVAAEPGVVPKDASALPTSFRDVTVREVAVQAQTKAQPAAAPPAQRPLLVELMQRIQAAETGQPMARAVKVVSGSSPVKPGLEPLMALLSEKKSHSESETESDHEGEVESPHGLPSPAPFTAQAPTDAPKVEEAAAPVKVLDQVEHAQHLARLQGKALIDKPRELEVHLHSHKLGEVAARVKVESDGQWSAHVQLRDAEVERSVRQELVQIQETRGLEGFTTSLSQDSRDQRGSFQSFAFDQQQSRTPLGFAPKKSVQPLTSADPSPIAKSSSVHGSPSGLNVRA